MNIHEYQAKEILRRFGVPVPRGALALTPEDAENQARVLGTPVVVIKAQIHAGGRGKAGGVRLAKSPAEAKELAAQMLGMVLKTPQTGPEGRIVRKVYVEQGLDIARELYLGVTLDRETSRVSFMTSAEGGVEIEETAAKHPEKILRESVDPAVGFLDFQGRRMAFAVGLSPQSANKFTAFCRALHRAYVESDAWLVVVKDGGVVALDAKMNFDDNALYRHPEIAAYRDIEEEDPTEAKAKEYDLAYIHLDGNIGCLVNGAGLAMATMDTIKLVGGNP